MNSRFTSLYISATMMTLLSALMLFAVLASPVFAAGMKNINVSNGATQSTVTISFDGSPDYSFFRCTTLNVWSWISVRTA